uniref:DUF659 domain-containing protein n=1 Tax=Cajanus cajan TaxID=3821 RepID=A0A151RJ97_CAJCA|nr:hypothetical protein KK1_035966 [Cajanus cajan]
MFKPIGDNIDVFWKWNNLKDKNNRKSVTCDFCLKTSTGGITRAKKHQLGIKGDVGACRKIPEDLKLEMKAAYESKKIASEVYMECVDENEEEDDIQAIARIKRPSSTSKENIKLNKGLWQTSLNNACTKEARARVIQYIAHFFYRNGIAFNVARSKSFKLMVEAIGTYGPHLKPPIYHELRVPLLKKELEYTKALLKGHEEERVKYGCSIMSDGWTNRKNKIPKVKRVIQRDIKLVGYIYNHTLTLNTMRKYTNKVELVRHGIMKKKLAMGYIYEVMERAKEAIQISFNYNKEKYKDIFAIVDRRWDCQLHHPLHATRYYLNPEFYYKNSTIMDADDEVVDGLFKCIDRLSENNDIVDNVHHQLAIY